MGLPWDCHRTSVELLWDRNGTRTELLWDCREGSVSFRKSCHAQSWTFVDADGTVMELPREYHWTTVSCWSMKCYGIAMALPCQFRELP